MAKPKQNTNNSKKTERELVDYSVSPQPRRFDLSPYYNPLMVILLIVGSFFLGRLSLEVSNLKKGNQAVVPTDAGQQQPEKTRPISTEAMKSLAGKLGMDADKFGQCLDGGTYATRVANEQKEGQDLGVSGTPTFFINGLMIVGAQPQSAFEAVIDAELKNGSGAVEAKKLGEDGKRNTMKYGQGPVMGSANAKIKVVEFTDFECPFCERAFPTIQAVLKKYEGKISLEYRSFPLPFHPLAQKAAEGALCAGDQGKFWEMHDQMFAPSL